VYQREAGLLTEWYCPAIELPVDGQAYVRAWDAVLPIVEKSASPTVTVLRDYHAENIMLIDRPEVRGLGLLDFQDALAGHPAYDLVSLLQDARRDVPPAVEAAMLDHYRTIASPPLDFDAAYAVLGAQRNAKIIGIFTRLWKRDGKPRYLSFLPRMWDLLERDLAHPALAPVADWFAANIPADKRHAALQDQAPA
jgi:aminoglycoside/choline kinase family phosphotransferase